MSKIKFKFVDVYLKSYLKPLTIRDVIDVWDGKRIFYIRNKECIYTINYDELVYMKEIKFEET